MRYDVAIVGLGGMGSAIAAHCARRGASVLGLEQFARGHDLGASSGLTRLIRKAYFEKPDYVPLLHRAYELWRELERSSGESLLTITGLLTVGQEDSDIIEGTRRSALEHSLPVEHLGPREIKARHPTVLLRDGEVGVFESEGGVVKPERAIQAQLALTAKAGAELRFETAMRSWASDGDGVEIVLQNDTRVIARSLVLSAGPWLQEEFSTLGISLRVQRNMQVWFTPETDAYRAGAFPPFLIDRAGLPAPLYGFPDFGDGVKAAFHGFGELTKPEHLERDVEMAEDVEPLVRAMNEWMPGAAGTFRAAKACMYALTPDEHFVIDRHPRHSNVILCGGFSGHGFKFTPVVGEIGADLALEGATRHPIEFLSARRFR